jgi:hypothetical protein
MRERRAWRDRGAAAAQELQPRIERDLSERDDDLDVREGGDFRVEVSEASRDLVRQRFVVRRRAPHRCGNERISEP